MEYQELITGQDTFPEVMPLGSEIYLVGDQRWSELNYYGNKVTGTESSTFTVAPGMRFRIPILECRGLPPCRGTVKRCRVEKCGIVYHETYYCDNSIEIDRSHGYTVVLLDEEPVVVVNKNINDYIDSTIENFTHGKTFTAHDVFLSALSDMKNAGLSTTYLKVRKYILKRMEEIYYGRSLENDGECTYYLYHPFLQPEETPQPEPLITPVFVENDRVYTRRIDARGSITIPKNLIQELGWEPGDVVNASTVGDSLYLTKDRFSYRTYVVDKNYNIRPTRAALNSVSSGDILYVKRQGNEIIVYEWM